MNETGTMQNFVTLERERYEPAREYAIRCLDYNIIHFKLIPGQFISEKTIADLMGISRTPAHEAIFDLSRKDMINIYPQRGSMISYIDENRVYECAGVRLSLENLAIEYICDNYNETDFVPFEINLAAQQQAIANDDADTFFARDNEFHALLFTASKRDFTYSFLSQMQMSFDRVRMLNLMNVNKPFTYTEHRALTDALKTGDKKTSVALIEHHLTNVVDAVESLRKVWPQYFVQ